MTPVHLSDRAHADFLALIDWLSNVSVRRANELIVAYEGVLEDLRAFPDLGTLASDGRTRILRRRGFRYLYTESDGRVILLRIVDPRRLRAEAGD